MKHAPVQMRAAVSAAPEAAAPRAADGPTSSPRLPAGYEIASLAPGIHREGPRPCPDPQPPSRFRHRTDGSARAGIRPEAPVDPVQRFIDPYFNVENGIEPKGATGRYQVIQGSRYFVPDSGTQPVEAGYDTVPADGVPDPDLGLGDPDPSETRRTEIDDLLTSSRTAFEADDASSDSEDVMDELEKEGEFDRPAIKSARRAQKMDELRPLLRSAYPVTDGEQDAFDKLQRAREQDQADPDRSKKLRRYAPSTRAMLVQRGEEMKGANAYHNRYLRRAFRQGVSAAQVRKGGSKGYAGRQGEVRKRMREEIESDDVGMSWKREDFDDDAMYRAFGHFKSAGISNDKKRARLHEAIGSGETDLSDTSALAAFHHVVFKAADGGRYAGHALNPANLTLRHDERELRPEKKAKVIASGGKVKSLGAHELDHQATGITKDNATVFRGGKKGGHFSVIDPEAIADVFKPQAVSRTRKGDLLRARLKVSRARPKKK